MALQQLKPTVNTATVIREWSQALHAGGGGQGVNFLALTK